MERIRQDFRSIDPNLREIVQDFVPAVLSYNGSYINQDQELKQDTAINWYVKGNAEISFTENTCTVSYKEIPDVFSYFVEVFCVSRLDGRTFKKGVVFLSSQSEIEMDADPDSGMEED